MIRLFAFSVVTTLLICCKGDDDPQQAKWEQMENYPGPLGNTTYLRMPFMTANGKGYVVNAVLKADEKTSMEMWEFDPARDPMWLRKSDSPLTSTVIGFFSTGGKLYLINSEIDPPTSETYLLEYDAGQDKWTELESTPFSGWEAAAIGISADSKAYVLHEHYPEKTFWEFDAGTHEWTALTDFPGETGFEARSSGFASNGKVYVIDNGHPDVWIFDPLTGIWKNQNLPASSQGQFLQWFRPAIFTTNDKVYIFRGSRSFECADAAFIHTPGTDQWRVLDFMPDSVSPRQISFYFQINDEFYVGAGVCESTYVRDVWRYTPIDMVTSQ